MEEIIKPGYTRVTEPLQGFSKYDMIDPEVLANAADRGTRVHKFCEMHAKGLWCMVDDDCINYVDVFRDWFDSCVRDVIFTEKRFYDDQYMITGQIDMACILKDEIFSNKIAIVDIKTTSNISLSWGLQTAAYSKIVKYDRIETIITRRIAINLPKTGSKVKVIEYHDYNNDLRLYLNCLELYRYLNPPKKAKETDFSVV